MLGFSCFDLFVLTFKTKIAASHRDSCRETGNLSRFCQRPDAVRAQGLMNQPPAFQKGNLLQVGAKGPSGSTLREAAIVTECRGFATSIALCHCQDPFKIIAEGEAASAVGE
jgi:hypothetical protein